MASKDYTALYDASNSLGKFLNDSYGNSGKRKSKESELVESVCEMVSVPSSEGADLSSESEPAKNVWKMVGLRPSEGMGVSDQMLTNGNYFTCYACADTYALLSDERKDAPEAWGTLEERRRVYAGLMNKAKGNYSRANHTNAEGAPPRDQTGKLKHGSLDQAKIREKFYGGWIFPRLSEDAVSELSDAVERGAEAGEGSVDATLGRVAQRILDEAKFYKDLYENDKRDKSVRLVEDAFGRDSDERRKLDCFRVLLPIWVYTQCLYANYSDNGLPLNLPLNLYNVHFWENESAVASLVEKLCKRFEDDGLSGNERVEDFRKRALELAKGCALDVEKVESAFRGGRKTETPTIRELFEDSLKNRFHAPDWAERRGELIWLIVVSCCVSIERALEVMERKTSDCLEGDESLLDANELGRGSGRLPLHISEGNRDLPSVSLKLSADAPEDEVLCVLGHAYEPRFWEVVWPESAHRLLGDFFKPEAHLGSREEIRAGEPRGLLARLWETTKSFDLRGLSRDDAVALGRLDVVGELRSALASRLSDCLEKSFSRDEGVGHGPELVLGSSRGGVDEGTLLGAVRAAVEDVCTLISDEWKIQMENELAEQRELNAQKDVSADERQDLEKAAESRSKRRPPNVKSAMLALLVRDTRGYFEEQGVGEPSQPGALFRQLEQVYKEGLGRLGQAYEEESCQLGQAYMAGFGSDPSMRFALARVRRELGGRLKKVIRLDDVWDVVKTVFMSVADAEKKTFLPLSLPDVSARHAVLYLEGGRLMVADAGSLNGTAVIRQPPDGAAKGDGPRRFVLRGSERTNAERVIEVTDGLGGAPETVDAVPLCRGDVIRLAGRTAIGVGNRL